MGSVLISAVVNLGFLVIQVVLAFHLGRSGRPYRKGVLVTHVIVSLLLLAGWVATFWKLQAVADGKVFSAIALEVAGLALRLSSSASSWHSARRPPRSWCLPITWRCLSWPAG